MNYLPKNISEKLHKLGCVSERVWCPTVDTIMPTSIYCKEKHIPKFIFQDLFLPENSAKIWGQKRRVENKEGVSQTIYDNWQKQRHKLIDLYPDGDWLGVVEEGLKK